MHVLVTGATGFIGSHLVDALLARGDEVRCLVRPTSSLRWLAPRRVELVTGDCGDPDSLKPAVRGVDLVFHAAGTVRASGWSDFLHANYLGTGNLLDACRRANPGLGRLVVLSSQAASGPSPEGRLVREDDPPRPISAYGWSKLLAEREVLAARADLPVVVVRPSPVYGPRDRGFHALFYMTRKGVRPLLGSTRRYFQLLHVDDLVAGCLLAAEHEPTGDEVYFLASEGGYCWEEIEDAVAAAYASKTCTLRIPERLATSVACAAELWAGLCGRVATVNRDKTREMLARWWLCDTSRARERLGFTAATPLRTGVEDTARWYRTHGWL